MDRNTGTIFELLPQSVFSVLCKILVWAGAPSRYFLSYVFKLRPQFYFSCYAKISSLCADVTAAQSIPMFSLYKEDPLSKFQDSEHEKLSSSHTTVICGCTVFSVDELIVCFVLKF
jgi:hypothetical protein